MKTKSILITLLMGLIIITIGGCSDPVAKKITGLWQIEDIKTSGDTTMVDTEQFRRAIEDQKQLRFELKADSSISIYTGASEIDGLWQYDKKSNQVLVTFRGNMEPTVLGSYEDGKLINRDTNAMGTIISTIFIKIETEQEQP